MGRLEDIVARNQRGKRPREKTVVMMAIGFALLVIIGLMLFTDLGLPPEARGHAAPREHRVDDIQLRAAPK